MKKKIISFIRRHKLLFNIASKCSKVFSFTPKNKYLDESIYRVYYLDNIKNLNKIIKHFNTNKKENYRLVIMVDEKNYSNIYKIINSYNVSIITANNYKQIENKNYQLVTFS